MSPTVFPVPDCDDATANAYDATEVWIYPSMELSDWCGEH